MTPDLHCIASRFALMACLCGSPAPLLAAPQEPISAVRGFGSWNFDTRSLDMVCVGVHAAGSATAVTLADGRTYVQGHAASAVAAVPTAAPGLRHLDVQISTTATYAYARLSDGSVAGWGDPAIYPGNPLAIALPPGVTCTKLATGAWHVLALGSDGQLRAFGENDHGQCNVPTLPAGTAWIDVDACNDTSIALRSDGAVFAWGSNSHGQTNVPPAPAGTNYTAVRCGMTNGMGILSNGTIAVWGDNTHGQLAVPPLPTGVRYTMGSIEGSFGLALRSDGVLVAWGRSDYGILNCPTAPPAASCVQIDTGTFHAVARWSDGSYTPWGYETVGPIPEWRPLHGKRASDHDPVGARFVDAAAGPTHALLLRRDGTIAAFGRNAQGQATPPALPPGLRYTKVAAGHYHSTALRSDGQVAYFGAPLMQPGMPALPPGVVYTDLAASLFHTIALRSDGMAVAFGPGWQSSSLIPPLPPGLVYTQVDCAQDETLLLRSDGQIIGSGSWGWSATQLPPGVVYTDLAAGRYASAAVRSDGLVEVQGLALPPPALPWGVHHVEADAGESHIFLRRSDGLVSVVNAASMYWIPVPAPEPGTSYVDLGSSWQNNWVARVGPTCTYTGYGHGCAGTRPAARLVPRDTPRIDREFVVNLFELPIHTAILITSLQSLAPLDLTPLGLPGCHAHVTPASAMFVAGQNHTARASFAIPNLPALVGMRFYQQAFVHDPGRNQACAVMSDAMAGVIGHW